jgi:PIN domain nuclease of toxin-antitoxin system
MAKGESMILDTCALLWLGAGDKKLKQAVLRKINEAAAVYVSAISGFEIALKVARGRLRLPHAPLEWFEKIAEHHGLSILPLDLPVCIEAVQLPPVHDDPCDRFIIATARLHQLPVVTSDETFEKYGIDVIF